MPASFTCSGSVQQILQGISVLEKQDRYIEEQLAACKKQIGYWIIGLVAGFLFFFLAVASQVTPLFVLAGCVGLAGLGGVIYWGAQSGKWKKEDLENRRYELARKFVALIGRDFPKKGKCSVNINFEGYRKHGQQVNQQKSGLLSSVRMYKYTDKWFTAKGALVDKTVFRVSIEQTVTRKEKVKRKYTKVAERVVETVTIALKLAPDSYPHSANLANLLQPCQLPGVKITRVLVQQGTVRIIGVTAPYVQVTNRYGAQPATGAQNLASGDTVLQLFLYVYGQLPKCLPAPAVNG